MNTKNGPTKHPASLLPSCEEMNILLDERVEHPDRALELDEKIRKQFEQEQTTFILDMSGFSRTVQRFGIIHYLSMIRRMQRIVRPAVERNGGFIVKFEADNAFAIFTHPRDAVRAAFDIHHDTEVANLMTADESDVHVSIGIGYGPVLLTCDDLYGNELNLAAKLGEDVAEKGEILLTEHAHALMQNEPVTFQAIPITVSGITINAYRVTS